MITENIKVFCRQRPLPIDQGIERYSPIVRKSNDGGCIYYSSTAKRDYNFQFDEFFDSECSQDQVYEKAAKPIVQSVLEGYSGTIFAYGPTGSGKTFTMTGSGNNATSGIMPRCIRHLLAASGGAELWVSYLQIYCEDVEDLLSPGITSLAVREKEGKVFVEGLSKVRITSVDDFWGILEKGEQNRVTAKTLVNAASSRSHAAVLISLNVPESSTEKDKFATKMTRESSLVLVDLAGSERASASEGRYLRLEEAKAINLSLSALGNCMSALAEGRDHIPYRDSKLTRLLQGCLGGGSRTSVVLTLPFGEDSAAGDVLSALKFAARAKLVKVQAKVTRFVDYEALYQETQLRLDEAEQLQRVLRTSVTTLEGDVAARDKIIESLREDLANIRTQMKDAIAERDLALQRVGDVSNVPLETDSREIETRRHEEEIRTLKAQCEKKLSDLKRAASSSANEATSLEIDLQSERQGHLASLQTLSAVRKNLADVERQRDERLQELLTELDDVRSKQSEALLAAKASEREAKDRLASLTERLQEAEGLLEGSVSRAQVSEMERLFSETVGRLADRVKQLEGSRSNMSSIHEEDCEEEVVEVRPSAVAARGGLRLDPVRRRLPSMPTATAAQGVSGGRRDPLGGGIIRGKF